jgi:hypothetical protein
MKSLSLLVKAVIVNAAGFCWGPVLISNFEGDSVESPRTSLFFFFSWALSWSTALHWQLQIS